MEYRSIAYMDALIRSKLYLIPKDIELVVGVPRSGLLPSTIIALLLNKPHMTINELAAGSIKSFSSRPISIADNIRKILVVDDSCNYGTSIEKAKAFIRENVPFVEAKYCCIFAVEDTAHLLDFYFEICPQPRIFEWNIMNHIVLTGTCMDMDGVLCVDPTEEENDDGTRYIEFIRNTKPLFSPKYKIGAIVTSRLEKYRAETEEWLKNNGIDYEQLIMLDVPDKATRQRLGLHAKFKAEIYDKIGGQLFIESDDGQARYINQATNKPVYCTGSNCFYDSDKSMDRYRKFKEQTGKLENMAYTALSTMYEFTDKLQLLAGQYGEESVKDLIPEYLKAISGAFDDFENLGMDNQAPLLWINEYVETCKSLLETDSVSDLIEYIYGKNLSELEILIDSTLGRVMRTVASRVTFSAWTKEHAEVCRELTQNIIKSDRDIPGFEEETQFLRKHGRLELYPYEFINEYDENKVEVYSCDEKNLKYVMHGDKKLFFPGRSDASIKHEYNQLVMEQDVRSPHTYFCNECSFNEGDIFVDVGAAEGIISLDIVEKAKEVYLIECSEDWIKALRETFAGYMHKVHIIPKYAGCLEDEHTVALDTLLSDYSGENIFIKMDIEGMELEALKSCVNVLLNNNCKASCATYHTKEALDELGIFFDNLGYYHEPSEGYMLFFYGKAVMENGKYERIEYPYFRHALIRAWK